MNFQEFWRSLPPHRRAVLVTIYQTGLSARTGGFYRDTVSLTVLLIDQICSTDAFKQTDDLSDEVNQFGEYLEGVFDEKQIFASAPVDPFERVCLVLKSHCNTAMTQTRF